jgi:hypothetical protein
MRNPASTWPGALAALALGIVTATACGSSPVGEDRDAEAGPAPLGSSSGSGTADASRSSSSGIADAARDAVADPPSSTTKDGAPASDGTTGALDAADAANAMDATTSSTDGTTSGTCLGAALLAKLGKQRVMGGLSTSTDATAAAAPFDIRYEYISGGLFDGTSPCASCASGCTAAGHTCANSSGQGGCAWWGCFQYDMNPPGDFVRGFDATAAGASQIPMFTYYEILQTALAAFSGFQEGKAEATQATSVPLMTRYFADWRFLLQQVGQSRAILHVEPDFWGYAEQAGSSPTALAAAVASANPTDCASQANTIAGMGKCMIAMARKYAPNAIVGLHASAWASNIDVALNTSASLDVAGEANKVATFLAAAGESDADVVIVEVSDRDAGYYQSIGRSTWWDATNATLPDFHQDFAWVKALTEALGKPALYWQLPVGNASQNNTPNHWQDNRVDYFFGHVGELAAAHVFGMAFGAGAGDQTTPDSDGGHLVSMMNAYASAPAAPFCP